MSEDNHVLEEKNKYPSMSSGADRWDIDNYIFENDKMQIMNAPWYDDLMKEIQNGGDIEVFIRQKDEKYREDTIERRIAGDVVRLNAGKEKLSAANEKVKAYDAVRRELDKTAEQVERLVQLYPEDRRRKLKYFLSDFARGDDDSFSKKSLTEEPKGLFTKLRKSKKIKKANEALQEFVETCQKNSICETARFHSDYAVRKYFENIMELAPQLELVEAKDLMTAERGGLIAEVEEVQKHINDIQKHMNDDIQYIDEELQKKGGRENKIVRDFVEEKREEIKNPKKFKINDYVEGLDRIADDELIMFNFGVDNQPSYRRNYLATGVGKSIASDEGKINKICSEQGLKIGNNTNEWMLLKQGGLTSDAERFEIWSPVMTAKEAKETMPRLVAAMDRAGISENFVIPMKAQDFLGDILPREVRSQEWIDEQLANCIRESRKKDARGQTLYGNSITEVLEEFPNDKYLYSGTMVSDDYFVASKRAGRNGTLYATPDIKYASVYDGVSLTHAGESATGDFYISPRVGRWGDKDVSIGFINVYEQNEEDRYFKNFGLEDARSSMEKQADGSLRFRSEISRDDAIGGFFDRAVHLDGTRAKQFDAETFITPDKNPLAAKFMHIRSDDCDFFIKVSEPLDEFTKYLLQQRKADIRETFAKSKPAVWERLERQRKELKDGTVYQQIKMREMQLNAGKEANREAEALERKTAEMMEQKVAPVKEMAAESMDKLEQKLAAKGGTKTAALTAEQIAEQAAKQAGILAQAAAANAKFDRAVDAAIDGGAEILNETLLGRAYDKAEKAVSNTKVAKAVGKTAEKAGQAVAKTAVGKAVTKTVAKTAGSAVGKSVLKKIPLVSLGAGAYFAWQRLKDGDWKGACGEVASGALGCLPGLGTAASTAIDVGLAARDISGVVNENGEAAIEQKGELTAAARPAKVSAEMKAEIAARGEVKKSEFKAAARPLTAEKATLFKKSREY